MTERGKDLKVRIILTPEQREQIKKVAGTEFECVEVAVEEDLAAQLLEDRVSPRITQPMN
jgi:hypothetical protein